MIKNTTLTSIETNKEEGKLLLAALAILTRTTYSNQNPNNVMRNVEELANKIFYEDEVLLRETLISAIHKTLNEKYYSAEETKIEDAEDAEGVPEIVKIEIEKKVDEIFVSLKKFGLFTDGPYQH